MSHEIADDVNQGPKTEHNIVAKCWLLMSDIEISHPRETESFDLLSLEGCSMKTCFRCSRPLPSGSSKLPICNNQE